MFAHESKESFNTLAKNKAEAELKNQGIKVLVSDLYTMKFKITATARDIVGKTEVVWVTQSFSSDFFFFSHPKSALLSLQSTLRKTLTMLTLLSKRGMMENCLKTLQMSRVN